MINIFLFYEDECYSYLLTFQSTKIRKDLQKNSISKTCLSLFIFIFLFFNRNLPFKPRGLHLRGRVHGCLREDNDFEALHPRRYVSW